MRPRYTRHQVARGARPDAETHGELHLIKHVTSLRATYQVRMLLYRAEQTGRRLVLHVPKACRLALDLALLRRQHKPLLQIVRT
jgi:hypothetical protein